MAAAGHVEGIVVGFLHFTGRVPGAENSLSLSHNLC
jgi:hypothetical protein